MTQVATKADIKRLEKKFDGKIAGVHAWGKTVDAKLNKLDKKIDVKTGMLAAGIAKANERINRIESKMATKEDLVVEILKVNERIDRVESKMATKDDVNRILSHIDAFAGQIVDYSRKAHVHDHRFNELEPTVKDHELRISALETPHPK
jgi:predicted  nucleic acid-binding Zn-ribbon protein